MRFSLVGEHNNYISFLVHGCFILHSLLSIWIDFVLAKYHCGNRGWCHISYLDLVIRDPRRKCSVPYRLRRKKTDVMPYNEWVATADILRVVQDVSTVLVSMWTFSQKLTDADLVFSYHLRKLPLAASHRHGHHESLQLRRSRILWNVEWNTIMANLASVSEIITGVSGYGDETVNKWIELLFYIWLFYVK